MRQLITFTAAIAVATLAGCSSAPKQSASSPAQPAAPTAQTPARVAAKPASSEKVATAPAPVPPKKSSLPTRTIEDIHKELAQPYHEGMAALEKYRSATECQNQFRDEVLKKVLLLQASVSMFNDARIHDTTALVRQYHTDLAFAFADAAMKRKCLDDADFTYRSVMEFYVGASYSGIRDRARLGIDDVRTARATAQAKTE